LPSAVCLDGMKYNNIRFAIAPQTAFTGDLYIQRVVWSTEGHVEMFISERYDHLLRLHHFVVSECKLVMRSV